jgi:hypothetical protein
MSDNERRACPLARQVIIVGLTGNDTYHLGGGFVYIAWGLDANSFRALFENLNWRIYLTILGVMPLSPAMFFFLGLGKEAAHQFLAMHPTKLILVVRSIEKGEPL